MIFPTIPRTAKKVSQIRTLDTVTLIEHLQTLIQYEFWTHHVQKSYCVKVWNTWCMQTEYVQMFDKCYSVQCSNLGYFFLQCGYRIWLKDTNYVLFPSFHTVRGSLRSYSSSVFEKIWKNITDLCTCFGKKVNVYIIFFFRVGENFENVTGN